MSLKKGDKAPEFKLFSSDKNEVSLSDYKGKNLVVLFFPLAFTSVCTAELCNIRDNYNDYEKLNTDVVGISVDSLFVLGKFKESEKYNFPLLSDFNKEVSKAFGVLYEEFPVFGMKGVSHRASFVIDKNGVIQHAEDLPSPQDMPNFDSIKNVLSSLN